MAKEKFTQKQQDQIRRAQKIINDECAGYIEILTQHVSGLRQSLHSKDMAQAILICHYIQSQAGMFGWPLATEISGWFKRLLQSQQKKDFNAQVNDLFLESFDLILKQELKAKSEAAVKLLIHIEAELKKNAIP